MGRIKEGDRKRTRHEKVRTGCDKCKVRRIKCPEGYPCRRCVIANLECTYNSVPVPKIFTLEDGLQGLGFSDYGREGNDGSGERRVSATSSQYGYSSTNTYSSDLGSSTPRSSTSTDDSEFFRELYSRKPITDVAILKSPSSSPYQGPVESAARDFSLHWLTHYTTPRSILPLQTWLQRIHQHAHYFPPLRNLVIAMGTIGLSISQGHDESTHNGVLQRAHKYTHSAIVGLGSSKTKVPTIVMLYCAWIFWQLDLIRGHLASSYLHVESAFRIAGAALSTPGEDPVDEAELNGLFGSTGPIFLIDTSVCPEAFSPFSSPLQRKTHALRMIRGTILDITSLMLEISTDQNVPADSTTKILGILESSRKDAEWLLGKWARDIAVADRNPFREGNDNILQQPQPQPPDQTTPLPQDKQNTSTPTGLMPVAPLGTRQQLYNFPPQAFDHPSTTRQPIFEPAVAAQYNGTAATGPPPPLEPPARNKDPSIIDLFTKALALAASNGYTPEAIAQFKRYALQFVLQIAQLVGQGDLGMRTDLLTMLERQRAWQGVV